MVKEFDCEEPESSDEIVTRLYKKCLFEEAFKDSVHS